MNDSYPSRRHPDKPHEKRSLLERLTDFISPEPETRGELLEILQDAHERNLIDADSLSMIEGVFQVSDLSARDIMIPRAQMDAINIAESP
jgi:magnesium and cobalt transporter